MSADPSIVPGFPLTGPGGSTFRRVTALIRMLGFACAGSLLAGLPIAYAAGARIVTTPSVPKGLWWVHPGTIGRHDFVNMCLPLTIARYGRARGYLDRGTCPGGAAAVMKMVVALPGDRVGITPDGIAVNGRLLADSKPQAHDHSGRPLRVDVRRGVSIVPSATYWLLGLSVRSWDSRYFGPVPLRGLLGLGTPIIISPTPAGE